MTADKILSDLKWIFTSPPILAMSEDFFVGQKLLEQWYERDAALFAFWETHPEVLLEKFKSGSPLLGKYFEDLWTFYFEQSTYFEVLLKQEQVVINGVTLGELDYVVKDVILDEVYHLEVALKYYMSTANSADKRTWIGPNQKDHLAKKEKRILGHQLKMIAHFPEILRAPNFKGSFAVLKGYLWPFKNEKEVLYPEGYGDHYRPCISWMHFADLKRDLLVGEYYLLEKLDWLLSRSYYKEYPPINREELLEVLTLHFFNHPKRSYLIGEVDKEGCAIHYIMVLYDGFISDEFYSKGVKSF